MKRQSFAASLALAVVAVLGLIGPVAANEQVPFKGSFEGDVTRGAVYFPYVDVLVEATGEATQLGQFTFANPHTVHIPSSTGIGTNHIVAANGDKLTTNATGYATDWAPGVLLIVEFHVIDPTGGTGRFAGATGSFTGVRLYDTVSQTTIGYFEGTISSPGP